MMQLIFNFLVFPGFLFLSIVGLLASWVDRKLTARVQWRRGPPWYQGFADIIKLLGKETIIPQGAAKSLFLLAPVLAFSAAILVGTFLGLINLSPQRTFLGDLIVVLYLLAIGPISIILAGFASANPIASIGASREMKLFLSYELAFILSITVVIIKTGGLIRIGDILIYQLNQTSLINSWSGFLAFIVALICIQAKLGLVPFDMPEAETEIIAGPYIEYSGVPLAIFKLTKAINLFVLPWVLLVLFWGGLFSPVHPIWGWIKFLIILVLITLIRNTNPRLRIDQAMKFFWGPLTLLAIIANILALLGQ